MSASRAGPNGPPLPLLAPGAAGAAFLPKGRLLTPVVGDRNDMLEGEDMRLEGELLFLALGEGIIRVGGRAPATGVREADPTGPGLIEAAIEGAC